MRASFCGGLFFLAALLIAAPLAPAGEDSPAGAGMAARLLTADLGDPREPGNVKLSLTLPSDFAGRANSVQAGDFEVYVFPADVAPSAGTTDRFRASGLYLWRSGGNIFLDVRVLPRQDSEGPASVLVRYAPGGEVVAEAVAQGESRFAADLADVVLAVDISRSMNYNDPRKRRVAAARTFIDMARKGGGIGRVGLTTFNHDAYRDTPLLPLAEGETLLAALGRVGADGLTNLDNPIMLSLEEFRSANSRRPVVILLTDGKNEGTRYGGAHMEAARRNARIFTVGLSEQADHALLAEMAAATGGSYFRAVKDSDLPEIYARLAAELGKRQLLHSDTLPAASGSVTFPIDSTVKRLVAVSDAGARLAVSGPGGDSPSGGPNNVHMASPDAGDWVFAWEGAAAGRSVLSLFGDTQFFLDLFPPQLRGDRLAVGATLAMGGRPLAGAALRLDAVYGGGSRRGINLYDDGQHNDGAADDGVYAGESRLDDAPDELDVTVRARGRAWDGGAFVRQATARAARVRGPPFDGTASVDGDVDFGVLFPGEVGTAQAAINLDAKTPRELYLELAWDGPDWPELTSSVLAEPGRRELELEMQIPAEAAPGERMGVFSISDGELIRDDVPARVRVGTVAFNGADGLDLGAVPPGGFVNGRLRLGYNADKAAPVEYEVDNADVMPTPSLGLLEAGEGELTVDLVVSPPVDRVEGDYEAGLVLSAGPGRVVVPIRWRVAAPDAPDAAPEDELRVPDSAVPQPGDGDSPWDDAAAALDGDGAAPDTAGLGGGLEFPTIERGRTTGDGFWGGWWVYVLAALLLLLLLLLLLAYILYRLGKSSLARFLAVSSIANFILLAVFIALLGTSGGVERTLPPAVEVSLVADEYAAEVQFSAAEREMLDAGGTTSAMAAASQNDSAAGEISFAEIQEASPAPATEKRADLPELPQAVTEIADARAPAVITLPERDRPALLRREHSLERATRPAPQPDLPEMTEPPPESAAQVGASPTVDEARMEIEAPDDAQRPVWSDGNRIIQPLASDQGVMLALATGMEAVSLDETAPRIEPRGRRRNSEEVPALHPEPRVEIDDPARDVVETAAPEATDNYAGDPGVAELRPAPRSRAEANAGAKPGVVLPLGASRLIDSPEQRLPFGVSGFDNPADAAARGGERSAQAAGQRAAAATVEPEGTTPGGLNRNLAESPVNGPAGPARGGDVGERRFDGIPEGVAGTDPAEFAAPPRETTLASGAGADSARPAASGASGTSGGAGTEAGQPDQSGRAAHDRPRDGNFDGPVPAAAAAPPEYSSPDLAALPENDDEADSSRLATAPLRTDPADWRRNDLRGRRRTMNLAVSSVDVDSLSLVVGDFTRLPDMAAERLFATLAERIGKGIVVDERRLSPADANLADCLLALAGPEEAGSWTDGDLRRVADYLSAGGHIWLDEPSRGAAAAAMRRLAELSGGTYAPLAPTHQLASDGAADALTVGGQVAAVVTNQNWRSGWRYSRGGAEDGAFRYLIRCLNYFLSGNAESGIVLDGGEAADGTLVEPAENVMPERLAGAAPAPEPAGEIWDDFGPATAPLWRMPGWSDPGRVSAMAPGPDGTGNKALRLDLGSGGKGRAAVYRALTPPENFAGTEQMTVEAFYDGAGGAELSLVLTVPEGGGWMDYEAPARPLAPGWNTLSFRLDRADFRPLTGAGGFASALPRGAGVGRAGFFVYRDGEGSAVALLRNIRLD